MADLPVVTCLGVDHTFADAGARSLLSLDEAQQRELLVRLRRVAPALEAVVLATCNRTELYVSGPAGLDVDELWHAVLMATGRTEAACRALGVQRRRREGPQALTHLFRVACGLESHHLGEPEILGQVRRSLALAAEVGTAGKVLHQALRMAIEVGRAARSTTDLAAGGAGIGAAVGATVAAWEDRHGPARVLLLGAGTVAASTLAQLRRQASGDVTIANRTRDRAERLADRHGAVVVDWERRAHVLADHDVVVSAVASPGPVLDPQGLASAASAGPLTCIDTALPATLPTVEGVIRLGIDDLADHRAEVLDRRREAVPEVEAQVAAMTRGWSAWHAGLARESSVAAAFGAADREDAVAVAAWLGRDPGTLAGLARVDLRRLVHQHVARIRAVGVGA